MVLDPVPEPVLDRAPDREAEPVADPADRTVGGLASGRPWPLALRLAPLAVLAATIAATVSSAAYPLADPDVWWHLWLGGRLLDRHSLSAPHWSSLATRSWVPSEPVPEIGAALAYRVAGLSGVAWLYGAALAAVVLTWYAALRARAGSLVAALVTVATALGASRSLTPRPQLVSFALLAVVLAAWLAAERNPRRAPWWLVPLTWVWALSHGFWFLGVALSLACWVGLVLDGRVRGRAALRLLAVPVLSGLVVFLAPSDFLGAGVWSAPFAVGDTKRFISEWQRSDLLHTNVLAVEMMVAAAAVGWGLTLVAWLRVHRPGQGVGTRARPSVLRLGVIVAAAGLTWYAERLVAVAAVLIAPLVAEVLGRVIAGRAAVPAAPAQRPAVPGVAPRRRRAARRFLAGWTLACLAVLAVLVPHTADRPGGVPTGLDAGLDALPAGTTVFNDYSYGGWLVWRHHDLRWTIDGLIVPYANRYVEDYFAALHGDPGWREFLARIDARAAVLPTDDVVVGDLERTGWFPRATGSGYVLLYAPGLNGGVGRAGLPARTGPGGA